MRRFGLVLMLFSGCASQHALWSRSGGESVADPTFLEQYAATRRFSAGYPNSIKVVPDGSAVLFLRSPARSFVQDLYEFNTTTGDERLLLTADQILRGAEENLSPEEKARRERMRLSARGIAGYQLSKDGAKILVALSGRLFVIDRATAAVKEFNSDKGYPIDPRFSPDGQFIACVRGPELFVIDIASGNETALTQGGGETLTHGAAEFVAQEEMDRREGYWWSPDSRRLAYQETSTAGMETMFIADAMHPEKEPQSWAYPRPGKPNADVRLGIMAVTGGDTKWVTWDKERYPYLATVNWKENAPLTILVQNRRQTEEALFAVDPDTGSTNLLLIEKDDAWVNLDPSMPKWFPDGSAFLWTTERNGWWQLELHSRDGQTTRSLTTSAFRYKGFVDFDAERKIVHLSGGDDPTQSHLFRLDFSTDKPQWEQLSTETGFHSATFSEDHRTCVRTMSTLDGKRRQTVFNAAGTSVGVLRSLAETPPFVPQIELTIAGDQRKCHAAVIRPRNFVASKKYPVIVSVYGGPHSQTVGASSWGYLLQQWIADHGFILVSIDGRGTPARGRDWERTIKGNFIDAPLDDQVAALQALGRKYREMDLTRVGIYGWSFGGYFSAIATMRRPDIFDAGVAGAPVADWADYDTHYTERYLGLPDENAAGYSASSVLTYADKLEKPLLIIHGTADDNVYFTHSLKMSNALFRAGKPHDFLALSDFTHLVADPLVTTRLYGRIVDFFTRNLNP